jgi:glycosyltransferase involved in cell wall biosynthesis
MKLFNWFSSKTVENNSLAIIDSQFPQKVPFGFRNYEINGLLENIAGSAAYAMYPMFPGKKAWFKHKYGINEKEFIENKTSYLKFYPENKNKIERLFPNKKYKFRLAYSYFLAETYTLLPFYNKNKIPFVFVLYPGGAFGLNNESSDAMLRDIFASPHFCGVIVTQDATRSYLFSKKMCPSDKIHFLFAGYVQKTKDEALPKKFYPQDKPAFDICFVAAKYSDKGRDKGYDLFIEAAHILSIKYKDMRFHVVGGFDESEIDVSAIRGKITFYGYKTPDFLNEFYAQMDICLSPNRLGCLFPGNFDGFPLGFDAMISGCALFTTDELNNNGGRFGDDEIVVIKPDVSNIVEKTEYFYKHLDSLYALSANGQIKTDKILNPKKRLEQVKNILTEIKNV